MRNGRTIIGGKKLEVGLHLAVHKSTGRQRRGGGGIVSVGDLRLLGAGMRMENKRNLELEVLPPVPPAPEAGGQRRKMKRRRLQEVGRLLAKMAGMIVGKLWQNQVPNTREWVSSTVAVGEALARAHAEAGVVADR